MKPFVRYKHHRGANNKNAHEQEQSIFQKTTPKTYDPPLQFLSHSDEKLKFQT